MGFQLSFIGSTFALMFSSVLVKNSIFLNLTEKTGLFGTKVIPCIAFEKNKEIFWFYQNPSWELP
jgi:hypothetical protein